ncbi:MAG: RNAase P [Euryarchaeota archaeon]|nr:RNAase P [Euryarchaeota archaeon]
MAKKGDFHKANRYAALILKISRKYNIRLNRERKMRICKKCGAFLYPGKTATVRLKRGKLIIKCHNCGSYKRYPFH